MKFGIVVVAVIALTAWLAQFLAGDTGYVVIHIRGWTINMSVTLLVLLISALIFVLWVLKKLWQAPRRIGEAAGRIRSGRAGQKLTLGMIEVAEGNFAKGERLLARSAGSSDSPLFNYLQAARAAHLQGQDERRDDWLRLAYEETPEATNAVLLTQAELQLDREQYEHALATLRRIEENSRDHSYAAALLGRIYFRLEDWDSLAGILPRLEKHKRIKAETLDEWTRRVHREMLSRAADSIVLEDAWKSVPKRIRSDASLQEARLSGLMRVGEHDRAEKEIAAALKAQWRGPIVRLYGLVEASDATKQLNRAEAWLGKRGEDPDLLLAAARLCLRNELWGKARSYLESVITTRPTPEAYQEYGRLLNQLGEADAAAEAFRDGLDLVSQPARPAIPHLEADPEE